MARHRGEDWGRRGGEGWGGRGEFQRVGAAIRGITDTAGITTAGTITAGTITVTHDLIMGTVLGTLIADTPWPAITTTVSIAEAGTTASDRVGADISGPATGATDITATSPGLGMKGAGEAAIIGVTTGPTSGVTAGRLRGFTKGGDMAAVTTASAADTTGTRLPCIAHSSMAASTTVQWAAHGMHGQSPIDFLFAQADANKDGKLTKDEVANFVWSRLSKADTNHNNAVTKDELKTYMKQRFQAMRAAHRENAHAEKGHGQNAHDEKAHAGKGHGNKEHGAKGHGMKGHGDKAKKGHDGKKPSAPAAKPADQSKPKSDAKAALTPEPKTPVKAELKAEVKPTKPELKGNSKPAAKAAVLERVKNPKAGTSAT